MHFGGLRAYTANMTNPIDRNYLSLTETAEYLNLSEKTLYAWVQQHKIPAYKVGRLWRFDRAEVDQFVKSAGSSLYNVAQCNGALAERSHNVHPTNP